MTVTTDASTAVTAHASRASTAAALDRAIARGARLLGHTQRGAPGAARYWDAPCDLGPANTAQVLVALATTGALSDDERAGGARGLCARQHADGGFPAYPHALESDLGATASAWAALRSLGDGAAPGVRDAVARARAFVDARGGGAAVVRLLDAGDPSAVFLALSGAIDARTVPSPVVAWTLFEPLVAWIETRVSALVPFIALQLRAILGRLRGDFGADGLHPGPLARRELRRCVAMLDEYQNPDGGWNANAQQTALALCALWGAGVSASDSRRTRAVAWLRAQALRDHDGLWFPAFASSVWSTAMDARALLDAGVAPRDSRVADAVAWLIDARAACPQPIENNRTKGAPRTGGWPFQRGNDKMPDCDDTGVVLASLGAVLAREGDDALPRELATKARAACDDAVRWLEAMQNPDGGWAAFVHGLPGKAPGPALRAPFAMDTRDPLAMLELLLKPPIELGDPSTEDLTARVLCGLGALGHRAGDAVVARALAFLRVQQCDDGAFWGRWTLNFVAGTSWVLLGAMAVGADPDEAWLRRAVDWLVSKQNADGGWGETPRSYAEPRAMAGIGPSMPPLTAVALQALLAVGRAADRPRIERAAAFLLRTQRSDGTWPARGYLVPNVPPATFYTYPETERHAPLSALARYRASLEGHAIADPATTAPSRWTDELLDRARGWTDPVADSVVDALAADGSTARVGALFATLLRSDDPMPSGLPDGARAYFAATEPPPAWVDEARLATAQALFERAGWQIASGLFSSSLPQAYAAASGATALAQTTGMRTEHVHQRVFETAQFLFDTMQKGAWDPATGRGVRAAQKVRLMHAGVRRLITARGWDAARLGAPINQEDMAGTLMTFSVLTLDALRALSIPYTADEAEAWLHAWRLVGHYLGVRPELVPDSVADGEALMDAIRRRQWARSEAGESLTAALIGLMRTFGPSTLGDMPSALIRALAGDWCADLLGVPRPNWNRFVLEAGRWVGARVDPFAGTNGVDEALQKCAFEAMRAVVTLERAGKDAQFRVPSSLERTVEPSR